MATPSEITTGLSALWTIEAPGYPAGDGWVIEFAMLNASSQIIVNSVNEDGVHTMRLSGTDTSMYVAGNYFYQQVAKKGSDAYLIETGSIEVKPYFATAALQDTRPHVKRVLDAIEAVIEKKASTDQKRYVIAGRELERYAFAELLDLRAKYKAEWMNWQRNERRKKGLPAGGRLLVSF